MPSVPLSPSGEQIEIRRGTHRAVITEVSGGVRVYEAGGRDLLDGYAVDEMSSGARGQLLIPWPNRLRDGRYDFDGSTYQVPLSEPTRGNAIHGLVRWLSWGVLERSVDRVVMEHTLHPRAGFPFALHLTAEYRLDEEGLASAVTATNVGAQRCPYGMGVHPYLRAGDDPIEEWWIEAPGATRLVLDGRGIPVGSESVDGTADDYRERRRVADANLDTAFTAVRREPDGRAWVRVWRADGASGVGLWMDERHPFYMLFTGDTLPDVARRRRSIAVEPMTSAPNALASGDGLIALDPGESVTTRWGVAPLDAASSLG